MKKIIQNADQWLSENTKSAHRPRCEAIRTLMKLEIGQGFVTNKAKSNTCRTVASRAGLSISVKPLGRGKFMVIRRERKVPQITLG